VKPFSPDLAALFDTRNFVSADLYSFTLPDGGVSYLTSADKNLTWAGQAYVSGAPRVERSAISQKTGLQVSSVKVTVYPTDADTIASVPWLAALHRGMFDGAAVTIQRAFAANWTQPITGVITMLSGRVADATFGRSKAEIEVNSWTELLSNQMPRFYYQSPCNNVLGDARCGVNRNLFAEEGVITGVNSAANLVTTLPAGQNWLTYGVMEMQTGACAGESRPIIFNSGPASYGNNIALGIPFSVNPSIGDVFVAYAGCDKTSGTCRYKFNNIGRFAGYPFIPAPETAM
jgi:uncharacterized phage protein (TIGR02218 family)